MITNVTTTDMQGRSGKSWPMMVWTCCEQRWELIMHPSFPERYTWYPVCEVCGSEGKGYLLMPPTNQPTRAPAAAPRAMGAPRPQNPAPVQPSGARTAAPPPARRAPAAGGAPVSAGVAAKVDSVFARWNKAKTESARPASLTTATPGQNKLGQLTNAQFKNSDKGPYIQFEFTIVEGDDQGEKAVRKSNMDTDEHTLMTQRDLRKLGLDVDQIETEAQLKEGLKALLEVRPLAYLDIVENGQWINVYIKRSASIEDIQQTGDVGAVEDPSAALDEMPAEEGGPVEEPIPAAPPPPNKAANRVQAAQGRSAAPAPGNRPAAAAKRPAAPAPAPEPEPEAEEPEAVEEAPVEEPAPERLEVNDPVTYLAGGATKTGTVQAILPDGDTIHVFDDEKQKAVKVSISRHQVSRIIDVPEEPA